ncbi:hypothetical protein HN587_02485 [Candidatus Woesearchaeota archaeon]|jgi:uncharacterized protein with PQ loop repeat|nr:hypothetical protein [Candidatus Woesearchaeota archaeon]
MIATIAGWLPAIILPVAAGIQLYKIIKYKKADGVSSLAWTFFAIANLGAYVFAEKYFLIQSILAFLLTAIINFAIAIFAKIYKS